MSAIAFVALGTPAAQGNHRQNRAGFTYDTNKKLGPWRDTVVHAARRAMWDGYEPMDGPLHLVAWFTLAKPKSAKADAKPTKKPDLDKLLRSLDALTDAGVWEDDSRVVSLDAGKLYVGEDHPYALDVPGATIAVAALADAHTCDLFLCRQVRAHSTYRDETRAPHERRPHD